MDYRHLKERLINMFDPEKLRSVPEEWGFYNENKHERKKKINDYFLIK